MEDLYFAYGSNLNSADFKSWCIKDNSEYPLEKVANAYIPDMRLIFNFNSPQRGGGVLNIRRQRGNAVPGALYRVVSGTQGWEVLNRRELAPDTHRQIRTTALTDDGRSHSCTTYLVASRKTEPAFVPPNPDYLKIVAEGYAEHGIGKDNLSILAGGKEAPWSITYLFVYGTFMREEPRHHILKSEGTADFVEAAIAPGMLFNSNRGYPLMVPGQGKVEGELYKLENPRDVFMFLDIVEDFRGYGEAGSRFIRSVITTITRSSRSVLAWAYLLGGTPENLPLIKSGDWRKAEKGA